MDTLTAFELVYELAEQNVLRPEEADTRELCAECTRQHEALTVVHDFIVNNLEVIT